MELRELNQNGNMLIDKYNKNGFIISGKKVEGIVVIFYNIYKEIIDNNKEIAKDDLELLISASPPIDILIFGHLMGLEYKISTEILELFKKKNIKIEKMITSSACRTYNLLVSENRKVGCVLFPDEKC